MARGVHKRGRQPHPLRGRGGIARASNFSPASNSARGAVPASSPLLRTAHRGSTRYSALGGDVSAASQCVAAGCPHNLHTQTNSFLWFSAGYIPPLRCGPNCGPHPQRSGPAPQSRCRLLAQPLAGGRCPRAVPRDERRGAHEGGLRSAIAPHTRPHKSNGAARWPLPRCSWPTATHPRPHQPRRRPRAPTTAPPAAPRALKRERSSRPTTPRSGSLKKPRSRSRSLSPRPATKPPASQDRPMPKRGASLDPASNPARSPLARTQDQKQALREPRREHAAAARDQLVQGREEHAEQADGRAHGRAREEARDGVRHPRARH